MHDSDAIDAATRAKQHLEACGWDVEADVLVLAPVLDPDDKQFCYMLNAYPVPENLDPAVRARIFDSLVATAEKFANPDKIVEAIRTIDNGEEV